MESSDVVVGEAEADQRAAGEEGGGQAGDEVAGQVQLLHPKGVIALLFYIPGIAYCSEVGTRDGQILIYMGRNCVDFR